jgi:hypothetical protein
MSRGVTATFCVALLCGSAFAAVRTNAGPEPAAGQLDVLDEFVLWDADVPLPTPEALTYPESVVEVVVHRADEDFRFLYDNAVVWHGDTLYVIYTSEKRHSVMASL